jgi:ring-1,2-phenylacetyl-CoA epoxidase subunit PaaE
VYLVAYKVKTQQAILCHGLKMRATFTIQNQKHVEVFRKKEKEKTSLMAPSSKSVDTKFYPLTVKEVRRETEEAVSISFTVPAEHHDKFTFLPGQYLTLKTNINGEEVRRSYSICAAPSDGELRVAVKEIEGGKFSTYANRELKSGDVLESMPPMGNFKWEPGDKEDHVVGWAAGSGITPILSIAKTVLESSDNGTFTLFYGNKNSNSIIFKDELEDLKNAYVDRFELHHVLSREDQGSDYTTGRIDAEKANAYSGKFFDVATTTGHYLCGPLGMIEGVSGALESMGTKKSNIHFELFNTAGATAEVKAKTSSKASANAKVTVVLDGEETHFEMGPKDYVLDAALDAGADVPYACKGAVCCTCRAKVLKGTAEMVMNYALVDDEVKDGYVLTCQTHATSDELVISFDE